MYEEKRTATATSILPIKRNTFISRTENIILWVLRAFTWDVCIVHTVQTANILYLCSLRPLSRLSSVDSFPFDCCSRFFFRFAPETFNFAWRWLVFRRSHNVLLNRIVDFPLFLLVGMFIMFCNCVFIVCEFVLISHFIFHNTNKATQKCTIFGRFSSKDLDNDSKLLWSYNKPHRIAWNSIAILADNSYFISNVQSTKCGLNSLAIFFIDLNHLLIFQNQTTESLIMM